GAARWLRTCQNPDGGFGIWQGGGYSYPYVTALAVKAMTRARARGYTLDERCYTAATGYLTRMVKSGEIRGYALPYSDYCWLAVHGSMLATLAEAGAVTLADLEPLYRRRRELPLTGVAELYRAAIILKADAGMQLQLRRLLLNALRLNSTTAYFAARNPDQLAWLYYSDVAATAQALEVLLSAPQPFVHADKVARWLVTQRKTEHWQSTYENAAVCEALASYYHKYESAEPDLAAMLVVPGTEPWEGYYRGRSTEITRVQYRVADLLAGNSSGLLPLKVGAHGDGRLYYEVRMSGVVPEAAVAADRGFAVERRLETLDGRAVDPARLKLSQTYRLRCVITNRSQHLFVAADVPLPAGLEGVDLSLATEARVPARQLARSDEPYWWSGFGRTEIRDDRVVFYADQLMPGRHEEVVLVRAIAAGRFAWPGARTEMMYEPEVFGRSAATVAVVTR
ncbi:MAG TPA: hypothetical protein PKM88_15030, partial [bacterium]|nr:hypothetical protein [bacterium]